MHVVAITLGAQALSGEALPDERARLESRLGVPVVCPLIDGVDPLVPLPA